MAMWVKILTTLKQNVLKSINHCEVREPSSVCRIHYLLIERKISYFLQCGQDWRYTLSYVG